MGIKDNVIWAREVFSFLETAKKGSINSTAEANFMKQSNLSKYLKNLEEELHCQLLERNHNGVNLTANGREVYKIAADLDKVIYKIKNFHSSDKNISGTIRLWSSDGLAAGYLSTSLCGFMDKYPNVKLEIMCTMDIPGVISSSDMAIVYDQPDFDENEIISGYELQFGLFASLEYLSKFGYPKNIKDFQENHRICTRENYCQVWPQWQKILNKANHIVATTNSSTMLLRLTLDGMGIGLHPVSIGQKEHNLIHLSQLDLKISHPFWIISHKSGQSIPEIKALTDYIRQITSQL